MEAADLKREATPAFGGAGLRIANPWFYVLLLALAYMVAFVDRQLLSLLVQPIRADFGISDTQFSLLHGLAFAAFYALFGFPLGWMVDRVHRIRLVAAGIAVWSVMTAACGLADNYTELFLARMGVGIGEAVLSPAAYSLISDLFDRRRLGRAMALYAMGITFGSGSAYLFGGAVISAVSSLPSLSLPLLGTFAPWQMSFLIVSVPGLLLAAVFLLLREPLRRKAPEAGPEARAARPTAERPNWPLLIVHNVAFGLVIMATYANSAWVPAFLARAYGFSAAEAGLAFGLILLFGGAVGTLAGGWISDRLLQGGREDAPVTVMAVAAAVAGPICAIGYFTPNIGAQLAASAIVVTAAHVSASLGPASLQMIAPHQMRGRVAAVYMFMVAMIGLGCGPTAVAAISDHVFKNENGVGAALGLVSSVSLLSGAALLLAIRRRFIAVAQAWATGPLKENTP